jgi:hypothetical protein
MADAVHGIRALPLYELISAPLVAMIEADAQAAKATLEFIEAVGFVPPEEGGPGADDGTEAGRLRMAVFRYKKLDENNEISDFVASVPVLSLVPVPAIQIKEAKISFAAKIADIVREKEDKAAAAPAPGAALPQGGLIGFLPKKAELIAKPAASSGPKDKEYRGTYHLEIEVSMGQADVPLGMEKVFGLMDQAIRDEKTPSSG